MTEDNNPLSKYYRQPAIYIRLPSNGRYYPPDVFTPTETGEIPVLPMTAKDELAFKTPDAMINGQGTVDVVKSCIPNLKDPWKMVNYDTDTILLAIRLATYGETMDVNYIVPGTNENPKHSISLPDILEKLGRTEIKDDITTKGGMKIGLTPLDYKTLTKVSIGRFEQRKMYSTIDASALTEEEKQKAFNKSFDILNKVNFSLLVDSIKYITTPEGVTVTDRKQIIDFCDNTPSVILGEIQDKLTILRSQAQVPAIKMKSTEEQIKAGAPVNYEIPITFDNSNFFG
tara:strand:- start:449 stop:1306 length:858 start_codon:yes stop_codon:yes gene_type:complete